MRHRPDSRAGMCTAVHAGFSRHNALKINDLCPIDVRDEHAELVLEASLKGAIYCRLKSLDS
jgi:hypothetical protein